MQAQVEAWLVKDELDTPMSAWMEHGCVETQARWKAHFEI